MTCCIGINTPEGILIAADTCVQSGTMIYERGPKLYRARRGVLACAGGAGITEMVAEEWQKAGGGLDALTKLLRTDLRLKPDGIEACFLWAGTAGLRALDGTGCVTRSRFQFQAIGAGEEIVTGYLGACRPAKTLGDARTLARRALAFATQCVLNVRPPFQIETWTGVRK